jgi:hypothetical protein
MIFKRKRPTDEQIEVVVLKVALLAKSKESVYSKLCPKEELASFVDDEFKRMKVKPKEQSSQMTIFSIEALLAEGKFLNEILDRWHADPSLGLHPDWRQQMRGAVGRVVQGAINSQQS